MQFLIPMLLGLNLNVSAINLPNAETVLTNCQTATPVVQEQTPDCAKIFRETEKKYGIPKHLLRSVAHVESGKRPWTIMINGKRPRGLYFDSKDAAHKKIKELEKQGIRNIDIGIMQVNNIWHPDAFDDHHEALDPRSNIEYAAKHIKDLYNRYKCWTKAIGCYHSHNPRHSVPYRRQVLKVWGSDRPASVKFIARSAVAKKSATKVRKKRVVKRTLKRRSKARRSVRKSRKKA
jgi:soluble lytic murein transglycosylase-like protein